MEEKLKQVIKLLKEIDNELENEMCLTDPETDDEYTFWGIASMIQHSAERRQKDELS